MPAAPDPIVSTPDHDGQPYDAASDGPLGKWDSVDPKGGPLSDSWTSTGDFENGPSPWRQT